MKLYIYRNGLCFPEKKIGTARQFGTSADVDAFMKMFVASCKPESLKQYRAFVTNDEVEFQEVDHYVAFNDAFGVLSTINRVKELDLLEIAQECNTLVQQAEKLKRQRKRERDLALKRQTIDPNEVAKLLQDTKS
jgi:hypothetical protein